ncbi:MAG: TetR/AcrR family transcriptional regulator [Deltaproteobacteria bacterium]|nr:TetR/AcrR family transcriptional regulator [Deltaproteobacteria bacterium]
MRPHISLQHEKQRKVRVRTIVRAARKLFLKKGYHATTIRDICRESGLSNGTLYFYFENKDALYAHIYEECFQHLNDMLERAVRPDMEPLEQIETALKTYLRYFLEHREMWDMLDISYRRLNLPAELIKRFDEQLQRSYRFVYTAVEQYFERRGLPARTDSRELALLLFTSIDGLFYDLKQGFFEDPIRQLTLERLVDTQINVFKAYLIASANGR